MWRSFFFSVGTILIFFGLQCLVVEEFRVDKNSRIFSVVARANRALDASTRQDYRPQPQDIRPQDYRPQNEIGARGNQAANLANQQRFSLPSSESYYGGPSRFQNSSYPSYPSAYGNRSPVAQQSLPANLVSSPTNLNQLGLGNRIGSSPRIKALHSYLVKDWMPWGFLAAGTIVTLYTNSTRHSRYSGD